VPDAARGCFDHLNVLELTIGSATEGWLLPVGIRAVVMAVGVRASLGITTARSC
jgi:hypothetical protein